MMWTKALQSGLQSATIMSLADVTTQWLIEGKDFSHKRSWDMHRTMRWTLAGLTLHGPYFFVGFSYIDKLVGPAVSLKVVTQKTALAQFCLFPPYLVALFGFMGSLENHPDVFDKIKTKVPEAFAGGCVYWPIANGINFAMVPPSLRVPYLATAAGIWNSYLSWENERDERTKQADHL
jgi:hypothetical protein